MAISALWLDGFGELTPQELSLLAALAPCCREMTLAFCVDGERPAGADSWLSIWSAIAQARQDCWKKLSTVPGVQLETEILRRHPSSGRFAENPVLRHLEENWAQPVPYPDGQAAATPPSPRDGYRQTYRGEMIYNQSAKLSSAVALEVSLTRSINISAATAGSNTDTRTYRSEWRWNAHLLPSLTMTQNNQIEADYVQYPFSHSRDNLGLNYNSTTMLSAALPGGFSIDVQHNSTQSPRGSYTLQPDGFNELQLSDESVNYALNASMRYSPTPALGLHVEPRYQASTRSGTVDGVQVKQRTDKRLDSLRALPEFQKLVPPK